ncbi:MAG TPA: vanadium-dependent haloperoxidase [Vicinamibacterales bacterium]|nr:vanadium-dependent haloperoxidase [Vicinamibacterales bacterium]
MSRLHHTIGIHPLYVAAALVIALAPASPAHAQTPEMLSLKPCEVTPTNDVVGDWSAYMLCAISQDATFRNNSLHGGRYMAMVAAAVFDAVNGVERRYLPIRVEPAAPRGASRRAAAVEAAYRMLIAIFPAQQAELVKKRDASLARITAAAAAGSYEDGDPTLSVSIARGVAWGARVAAEILAWRSGDLPPVPPFLGETAIGKWRPTPPAFASGAGPQFATMSPWVILAPNQFRPAPPPALTSAQYTADFNEVKASPTPGQVEVARFWNDNTPAHWNRIMREAAAARQLPPSESARLFALLNLSMADAAIVCWEAKYYYNFWRPLTAVELAELDGNPDTAGLTPGTTWTTVLTTPAHPEYPSGHSTQSSAAAEVLASFFGDATSFTTDSEALPVLRNYSSFAAAVDEIHGARIWAGIHFRTACAIGSEIGRAVATYVAAHAMTPVHGDYAGQ